MAKDSSRTRGSFDPAKLDRAKIAQALLERMDKAPSGDKLDVIIHANLQYAGGIDTARWDIMFLVQSVGGADPSADLRNKYSGEYVFASLTAAQIRKLGRPEVATPQHGAIYKIWLDHDIYGHTHVSRATIKADAASVVFRARGDSLAGDGVVWAVIDSGVDGAHLHFEKHGNLKLDLPLKHADFTGSTVENSPLIDDYGHGTHVAGIIAGEFRTVEPDAKPAARQRKGTRKQIEAWISVRENADTTHPEKLPEQLTCMAGMAPRTKIVSLKALDANGKGKASNIIAALGYIDVLNNYGRNRMVDGVNISIGYDVDPSWYACGQSPLCLEVNRLAASGVVVVVAAGNTGAGFATQANGQDQRRAGIDISINDPGNAEGAITVGSTHREMPHKYGVSYFSSKGPTGDGRMKPDLVAPGEKILSCASAGKLAAMAAAADAATEAAQAASTDATWTATYIEDSGTSMAAPHVSGAIAAFLSVRREFLGDPQAVKRIFTSTASDLGRDRYFQGAGMIDLMRAIQSI